MVQANHDSWIDVGELLRKLWWADDPDATTGDIISELSIRPDRRRTFKNIEHWKSKLHVSRNTALDTNVQRFKEIDEVSSIKPGKEISKIVEAHSATFWSTGNNFIR